MGQACVTDGHSDYREGPGGLLDPSRRQTNILVQGIIQRPQWLRDRDQKLLKLAQEVQDAPRAKLTTAELQNIDKILDMNLNFAFSLVVSTIYDSSIEWAIQSGILVQRGKSGLTHFIPGEQQRIDYGNIKFELKLTDLRLKKLQKPDNKKVQRVDCHRPSRFPPLKLPGPTGDPQTEDIKRRIQSAYQKHCNALDMGAPLTEEMIDECQPETVPEETRIKTIRQLVAEKLALQAKLEQKSNEVSAQKKLIDAKLAEKPPVNLQQLQQLKETSEATAEFAKIADDIVHTMDLETENSKDMLATNEECFRQSIQTTTDLYKLAAKADINFQQLGGNKGTPFLSRCRAAGCTNPEIYAWYHPADRRINTYDAHNAYYLMIYPDDSGRIRCTHCEMSVGAHMPHEWLYSCDMHKDDYRSASQI